jgi:hypothetical protein
MRYDEFRDRWLAALRTAGLLSHLDRPEQTIDLGTTGRRWRVSATFWQAFAILASSAWPEATTATRSWRGTAVSMSGCCGMSGTNRPSFELAMGR